jgi:transposase-like protein
MSKRRTHSPEFKARVAMEAISGRKTIQEIAADQAIHPIQVSQWKRQLLDGASELFTRGKKTKDQEEGQAKEAELFQQIGRLQMELEWLKKNLSCSDARELRKLVDHAHAELSVSRQCALLGLPRSTLYYRPTPVQDSTLRIMASCPRSWNHAASAFGCALNRRLVLAGEIIDGHSDGHGVTLVDLPEKPWEPQRRQDAVEIKKHRSFFGEGLNRPIK